MTFHEALPLEDQFLMAFNELLPLAKEVLSGKPGAGQALAKKGPLVMEMVPFGKIE